MRMRITSCLILTLFITLSACGQRDELAILAETENELDSLIEAEMERRHIPGASIAWIENGEVVWAKGYGLAHIEKAIAANDSTPFLIGSVTKQFTATAVMMLVEEGTIDLDEEVRTYLPALPAAYHAVSVRHLLTHTSGIPRDFKVRGASLIGSDLYAALEEAPPDFAPGTNTAYSNTGFVLLGMLIEAVSGKSYNAFLEARIFTPLGMKATRVFKSTDQIPGRAMGYEWQDGTYRQISYLAQRFGAGSIISTVLDMAKWDAALYTDKLVQQATLARMWNPHTLQDGRVASLGKDDAGRAYNAGFGWFMGHEGADKLVHHGGAVDGFSAHIDRYMNKGITVIALCNNESGNAAGLAQLVADYYFYQKGRTR